MSSPRGFAAGGIGGIGTEDARRAGRVGDGLRVRFVPVDEDEEVREVGTEGVGRAKRKAKGLKGSLERSGGWRMLRYMLKLRRARFACGTYLRGVQ